MADNSAASLAARIDALAADLLQLRQQLSSGVGVPDMTGQSGKYLTNDGNMSSWAPTPTAVTSISVTAPITSTGGTTPTIGHANSGVAAGTYTYPTITLNASGHVTSIANGTAPVTSVTATSPIVSSGGTTPTLTHATSGVGAGTYNYANVTVNAYGHVTSISANSPGTAIGYNVGTSGGTVPLLNGANTWSAAQTFSAYANFIGNAAMQYGLDYATSITPTTTDWYRVATLPATNVGQEAVVYVGVGSASYRGAYKFTVTKTTSAGGGSTKCEMELLGRFSSSGLGITSARVVDGGINGASYIDVQFGDTATYSVVLESTSACLNASSGGLATLGLASQGTAAAGTPWTVTGYMRVLADTAAGVIYARTSAGLLTENKKATFAGGIGLSGTTSQYVRGDGSLATFPAGSGTVTSVAAGAGMSFSTFTTTGTITLGTPSSCTDSSANSVSGTTHTHALQAASASVGGVMTSGTQSIVGAKTFTTSISSPSITRTSDASIKDNIRDLRDGLEIIRSLVPRRFYNKATSRYEVGFIAQEVEPVLPEVVSKDGLDRRAVAYDLLTAPIIAALQSIDERLSRLEAFHADAV